MKKMTTTPPPPTRPPYPFLGSEDFPRNIEQIIALYFDSPGHDQNHAARIREWFGITSPSTQYNTVRQRLNNISHMLIEKEPTIAGASGERIAIPRRPRLAPLPNYAQQDWPVLEKYIQDHQDAVRAYVLAYSEPV